MDRARPPAPHRSHPTTSRRGGQPRRADAPRARRGAPSTQAGRDARPRRQHAPAHRTATPTRRTGKASGRSAAAAPNVRRLGDVRAKREVRIAPRPERQERPPRRRPPRQPDPRQRARRTIRTRTKRLTTRFSAGQPRRRLIATLVAMLVVLSAVLVKVGLLQTVEGDSLRSAAAQQWTRERPLRAQRGSIFDRNGEELALSVPASTVAVNPKQVNDPEGTADVFADVLGLSKERRDRLAEQMAKKDRGFLYVARQVDNELAEQLDALDLLGVTIYREDRRMLPGGDTGRSVIGRTDIDGKGIAGLELQYENVLAGTSGKTTVEVAPGGRTIAGSERVVDDPIPGNDIVTTLDRSVQYAAEQALLHQVSRIGAKGAQAIVMDSRTGEIYAMASVAIDSDTGRYEITSGNYAAVSAYEPGSVGKVITVAAALNDGVVTPDTVFTVPWYDVFTKNGDRLHDSHMHATEAMTVSDILTESSNIGTIYISQQLRGPSGSSFEQQDHYMRLFGLGKRTALNFPDENPGILAPWQTWEGTEKFTVAYGQGVASSPIQLISAVNVIANDGTYVAPKLVRATVDARGEVRELPASPTHEVLRPEIAETMQQMMKRVVCEGTAKRAQVPGLSIAGKTGTGYIAQADGGYVDADGNKAYYASFVGFLPAEDPQVTILVSVERPPADSNDRYGGTAAAPVFQELAPVMVHELDISQPPGSTGCPE